MKLEKLYARNPNPKDLICMFKRIKEKKKTEAFRTEKGGQYGRPLLGIKLKDFLND